MIQSKKFETRLQGYTPFNIMACDPSYTHFGFIIIMHNEIVHADCIMTDSQAKKNRIRKGDDDTRRLNIINMKLKEIIREYKINYLLAELSGGGSKSSNAAKGLAFANCLTQAMADWNDIGIEWYSEADAKKCLFGRQKNVSKNETKEKINKLYKVPWTDTICRDEHIADAVAIYHTALQQSSVLRLNKKIV